MRAESIYYEKLAHARMFRLSMVGSNGRPARDLCGKSRASSCRLTMLSGYHQFLLILYKEVERNGASRFTMIINVACEALSASDL